MEFYSLVSPSMHFIHGFLLLYVILCARLNTALLQEYIENTYFSRYFSDVLCRSETAIRVQFNLILV